MKKQLEANSQQGGQPFALKLTNPFSTFDHGHPKRIPYLIDGLLPEGAFSILAGKPKHGKSSLARYEAVCVAKGEPFLGREVERGEVLLINLEDPVNHVDNCLMILGWSPETDEAIYLASELSPEINASIQAIEDVLTKRPLIRLVIVDTLAKLLRVGDMNDYSKVLSEVEKIHDLARKFPQVHIQGLCHCKKVQTDDPFDSLLGSTALRGEPDSTLALYNDAQQRVIASETRIGRNISPTVLTATVVESAGANVVSHFSLDMPLSEWKEKMSEKTERGQKPSHEDRVIAFLRSQPGLTATLAATLAGVVGRNKYKLDAIENLAKEGVLVISGTKHSPTDPSTLHMNETLAGLYQMGRRSSDTNCDAANVASQCGEEFAPHPTMN